MINIKSLPANATTNVHPEYSQNVADWYKYQLTFDGGDEFNSTYLQKLSAKEETTDYDSRLAMAYCPNFAGAAIEDIKNSIFQRTADVTRIGGAESYISASTGVNGGVDNRNNSLSTYIGTQIIDQLLIKGVVGVLIDKEKLRGPTRADNQGIRPYLTTFRAENILNWAPIDPVRGLSALLLREYVSEEDEYGLPKETKEKYRLLRKTNKGVEVTFFDEEFEQEGGKEFLKLSTIPFVFFKIQRSLLTNVANYQIALLNLESSDISYAIRCNFPFFYEFKDFRAEPPHVKHQTVGDAAKQFTSSDREVEAGLAKGRQYPKDVNPPGFVNPDPETLRVSMEKGAQLKNDIRSLINLNLQALNPRRQAADSKQMDERSLEAGLSFIGLSLQAGEQNIAEIWSEFEGYEGEVKITYPRTYTLKDDKDRQEEADRVLSYVGKIPSDTAKKQLIQKAAIILLGTELPESSLMKMLEEISNGDVLVTSVDVILQSHEAGLVDDKTASRALGYNPELVEKAKEDRAERIKMTMELQGGIENANANRGVPEFGKGEDEKQGKPARGSGRKTGE